MFKVENITKTFDGNLSPVKNLSINIEKGDIISLIGPSGTGKSTLLRCLNMLDPPTEGKIFYNGEEITAQGYDLDKLRMKVGMVFQSFNLFNHQTAIENIMMPQVRLLKRSRQEAYDKGMELLERVGLKDKYLQYPAQLSGGQKQRVAIARALAMEPEVMLLDEPTSALDPTMVDEVDEVISKLASTGMTIIIVTHDMNFARSISNRVFYMDEGIVYEEGTPEDIFDNPKKLKTIQFIKKLSVSEGDITSKNYDFMKVTENVVDLVKQSGMLNSNWNYAVMILDELINNILLPYFHEEFKIHYAVEFGKGNTRVKVSFSGEKKDIKKLIEENVKGKVSLEDTDYFLVIPSRIISGCAKDIVFTYDRSEELPNCVSITVKSSIELIKNN